MSPNAPQTPHMKKTKVLFIWKKISDNDVSDHSSFLIALVKVFFLGKQVEKQKQTKEAFKIATTRLEVENEINKKNDADERTKLSNWLRDE
ncbi:hypothetical protein [Bartonella sp. TS82HLJMH]|uniref:hypothetical protein n=1 Tax=Bartonella sp. TS82HLJMH TaxID=3243577 RepID=UPI0035CFF62D